MILSPCNCALLTANAMLTGAEQHPHLKKWLRYYLDFCLKYAFYSAERRSFPTFDDKLQAKYQSEGLRKQAFRAVMSLYMK